MLKNRLLIFAIFFVAFILRVWGLNKVPPELFGDELDVGYHAYSLLKTFRDYYGQFLPTYIHSFSEWRAPLLMYVTAPFVAIFGLNEWGVRLPSVVFGIISIWFFYLIVKRLRKQNRISLELEIFAGLFFATVPWHIQYSRSAFEVSLLLFLILSATYFFLKSLEKGIFLIISAFLFSLTFYTYSTANLFIPLYLILVVLVFRRQVLSIDKKVLVSSFLIFLLLSLPMAFNILFGHAADRFKQFSVFTDEQVEKEIIRKRLLVDSPSERLFHNKYTFWFKEIVANYASSFSPQFLFITGDIVFRHSIHTGELFWVMLPLLIIGFYRIFKLNNKSRYFWIGWLFLAPIPSSLTRDGAFHATRLILMLPPLIFLASLGIDGVLNYKLPRMLKKATLLSLGLVFVLQFGFYIHEYWIHYPKESWRWWQVGYKEALEFMKNEEKNYDILAFNNTYEPSLIRFLFWWKYPPERFLKEFKEDKEKKDILPGFNGFSLEDKYFFGSAKDSPGGVSSFVKPNMLYLVSHQDEVGGDWDWEDNPPEGIKVLKTIRNPYGEPIFYVVTGN